MGKVPNSNKKDLVNRFRAQSPELNLSVTYPPPFGIKAKLADNSL